MCVESQAALGQARYSSAMNRKSGAPGKVSTFHSREEQNVPGVTFLTGQTILPLGWQGRERLGVKRWDRNPAPPAAHNASTRRGSRLFGWDSRAEVRKFGPGAALRSSAISKPSFDSVALF